MEQPNQNELEVLRLLWNKAPQKPGEIQESFGWEIDNGNQTVTKTFYPPFAHVDRIEDYRTAYRVFSERLGLTENNKEPA